MTARNVGTVRFVSATVGVILFGFVVVLATRESGTGTASRSPLIGQLVPAVAGVGLNEATFDVDDFSDRWVLINFFASWCVPCEREHPELDDWSRRHKKDGVVVSIPFGDTEEDARAFFAEHGGDWPVLMDGDAAWAVAFGVLRPPESFLVGPGGIVVAKWQGQITADEVDRVVNDLERKAVDR